MQIFFFFFLICKSLYIFFFKDEQKKVRDEILRVLGDDLMPNMEQQRELKYMNMVINENLRLYPPVCTILFLFVISSFLIFTIYFIGFTFTTKNHFTRH
jgi:hypothetical protein